MNKLLALSAVIAATALGIAGCSQDRKAAPSSDMFASCPKGDAGRMQDKLLRWPDQWVCVK